MERTTIGYHRRLPTLHNEEETTEGEEEEEDEEEIESMTDSELEAYVRTRPARWCVCGRRTGQSRGRVWCRRRHTCCGWRCLLAMMLVSLLVLLAVVAWWDDAVNGAVLSALVMTEGSQRDELWRSSPFEVRYAVRVFNLTNHREFMAGGRPRVQEVGPYVYTMQEVKENVHYREDGTVSYQGRPLYHFQPHLSGGSENDIVYTVNIPFVNAADMVKDSAEARAVLSFIKKVHRFNTIRRLTVGELLWGHQSRVLNWARGLQDLPYPHRLFGLLVGLNDTLQPPYVMHTGLNDPSKTNRIVAWNNHEVLDFWHGDMCNILRGTDANGFAPGVSPNDTLYVFNGQLCRSLPLVYHDTVTTSGLKAYRFVHPTDIFSYGPDHPDNHCYCGPSGCPPEGILDMKPCYFGASVGFSFPHFYNGDPKLRHIVRGLRPDEERHRTEFDIYPDLGVPLRVKLRMQMNVILDREQALERARHFDVVLPIFWFEVGIDSLPGEVVGLLKLAQNLPPVVKTTSVTLCTALTLIFLMLLLAQTVAAWCGWGSSAAAKRAHTPEHLPAHHHYRSSSPPWDFEDLHKPHHGPSAGMNGAMNGIMNGTMNGHIGNGFPAAGVDIPVIDDHTLLPPYRRRDTRDIPDHGGRTPDEEEEEDEDAEQVPPPYSPGPTLRTPSTVSVEVHTTASDDDIAELPLDPAPTAPPRSPGPETLPPPMQPQVTQVVPLREGPPHVNILNDTPTTDDSDDPEKKPIPVSPEPPFIDAPILNPNLAPLAKTEDSHIDSSSPSECPTPPSPQPMSTFKPPSRASATPPSPSTPRTPSTPPELRPEMFGEMPPDINLDMPPAVPSRPPRSPRSPRSHSPHSPTTPTTPTAPLATSSPHGSNGVSDSRRNLPPPLESDL